MVAERKLTSPRPTICEMNLGRNWAGIVDRKTKTEEQPEGAPGRRSSRRYRLRYRLALALAPLPHSPYRPRPLALALYQYLAAALTLPLTLVLLHSPYVGISYYP